MGLLGSLVQPAGVARDVGKWARLSLRLLAADRRPAVYVLMYHRVGGGTTAEIDLPVDLFVRQLEYVRRRYRIVSLDALADLRTGAVPENAVVLTFDDGHAEMYSVVLAVLRRFEAPATIYLPTAYIEDQRPFDWGHYTTLPESQRPRPLSWDQARILLASGLITVGAHTHTHLDLARAAPLEIEREITQANALLASRLGIRTRHFAYPFGRVSPAARALVDRTYDTAVVGGSARNLSAALSLKELYRMPVSASDGYWLFRLRLSTLPGRPPRRRGARELT